MKNINIAIIQILFLILPVTLASAEFNVPHIIVFGTAETEVIPDKLQWSTSLKNSGGTVSDVADNHTKAVSQVLSYLFDSGIPRQSVKTSRMQLQDNYVYRNNSRLKDGYFAHTQISFETTEFETYLSYWKKLSAFKDLTIDNVSFDITNRIEIQHKTRIAAAIKAKEKAINLAAAMDTRLVEPLLIEEIGSSFPSPRNTVVAMEMAGGSRGQSPISPGKQKVRATVRTIFRIAPAE